jgi:hypothetical protein
LDPVKLIIFATVLGLFLVLTRRLFSSETVYDPSRPPLQPDMGDANGEDFRKQPAITGAELDLPLQLPPRKIMINGHYNRPDIANYYFKNIDLQRGPEDPLCFCDELTVQFIEPETADPHHLAHSWSSQYVVATPAGLQKLLKSTGDPNLIVSGLTVIVPEWDLPSLLRTIFEDLTEENYAGIND